MPAGSQVVSCAGWDQSWVGLFTCWRDGTYHCTWNHLASTVTVSRQPEGTASAWMDWNICAPIMEFLQGRVRSIVGKKTRPRIKWPSDQDYIPVGRTESSCKRVLDCFCLISSDRKAKTYYLLWAVFGQMLTFALLSSVDLTVFLLESKI